MVTRLKKIRALLFVLNNTFLAVWGIPKIWNNADAVWEIPTIWSNTGAVLPQGGGHQQMSC